MSLTKYVTVLTQGFLLFALTFDPLLLNAFSSGSELVVSNKNINNSNIQYVPVVVHNGLIDASDIPVNCSDALVTFTDEAMNLTRCSLLNARPIRLCRNCYQELNATTKAYEELKALPDACQTFFFRSDQIGVINTIYNQARTLWNKSHCANCYTNANETSRFFELSDALDVCILNANQSSTKNINSTCELCHNLYADLNDLYNKFVNKIKPYGSGLCMDVVDEMNITRRLWNKQNCISFDADIGYPNVLTAVLVGTMPVFFYLLAKNVSIIEDVKIVRPKRKSYASMQPAQ